MRLRPWAWVLHAVAMVVLASCASNAPCDVSRDHPGCPDLRFEGRNYDEWRQVHPTPPLQEIGDAAYPACNHAKDCGPDPGGYAATDVWRLEGVDPGKAVIAIREDTDTYAVFVRRGLDPENIPGLQKAAQRAG